MTVGDQAGTTTGPVVPQPLHPAKWSKPILDLIGRLVDEETARVGHRLRVLDPMGGVGRTHDLDADTVVGDLEIEWAACRRPAVQADAARLPFRRASFDAYLTSCTYGSRMADHHEARDTHKKCDGRGCAGCKQTGLSPRKTYRHALGHPLRPENTGAMQWGSAYRDAHRAIWAAVPQVVRPGGLVVVNVSNHVRDGEVQTVMEWHLRQLRRSGLDFEDLYAVPTRRMLHGANREARVDHEHVIVMRVPA